MSLTLYYDLLSQPSRAIYIFLKICDIPFQSRLVNLRKVEHLTPEYQKVHPFQKVPAIEHNGFKVIERYNYFIIYMKWQNYTDCSEPFLSSGINIFFLFL